MKKTIAAAVAVVALALGLVAGTSSAGAAPNHLAADLTCGTTTYHVTVKGNGAWAPAHDDASKRVFHPVAFGVFTGTVTNASGAVVQTFTEPAITKSGGGKHTTMSCTYRFTVMGSGSDPMLPAGHRLVGTGQVTAWVSGA